MKRFFLVSLVMTTALFFSASAQMELSIATGGTGGTYYPTGGAYAELINNYLEGYTAVAEVTGASVENAGLIARGDADIALALGDTVVQAYLGEGRFDGLEGRPGRLANLRALGTAYANTMQIVTIAGSGINSLADLKGKRVSVGAPGSGTEVSAATLLEANGLSYDDFEVQRLNFNETASALKDGTIDVGFWSVGAPTSSILDLDTTREIAFLALSENEVAFTLAVSPVFKRVIIAAGTYPNQTEDVLTIGTPNVILVSEDMDDDLAYAFLDALYSHIDEVIAVHPSAKDTTPENSLSTTPIPLHAAAVTYYEDNGYEVPSSLKGE